MTAAQRAQLQKALLSIAREIAQRDKKRIEPNRRSDEEIGGDEDEQPLNEMLQSIASNRNRNDAAVSARTDRALAKLRDEPDSYGECEECGEEIGLARLKAMPYAELCVTCQGKRDAANRGGPTRRKLTDYVD
jgi:DnaK suppressor protein